MRHEALLALARAVYAADGSLTVPVDDVALILATVALSYAHTPVAEGRAAEPPLTVVETVRPEPSARRLLQPLVRRGALTYRSIRDFSETADAGDTEGGPVRRHPVTPDLLEIARPAFAVLLSPAGQALEDGYALRCPRTYAFRSTFLAPPLRLDFEDPTDRLLEGSRQGRWGEGEHNAIPYSFVMQRLVREWTQDERRAR